MTTMRDLIRAALTDEPQTRSQLAEQLGLDAQAISVELNVLKGRNEAERRDGGWVAGSGKAEPTTHTHEAAAPAETPRPKRGPGRPKHETTKPKRETKAPKVETAPRRADPLPTSGVERECEFAISESGAVLFKVVAGPRSGQLGAFNHRDAMALFRLMDSIDWIRENA